RYAEPPRQAQRERPGLVDAECAARGASEQAAPLAKLAELQREPEALGLVAGLEEGAFAVEPPAGLVVVGGQAELHADPFRGRERQRAAQTLVGKAHERRRHLAGVDELLPL